MCRKARTTLDAFACEDALEQVAELVAGERLEDERGETRAFDLLAQLEIFRAGEGDNGNCPQTGCGADAALNIEGFPAGKVEIHQHKVRQGLHLGNLLGNVCASRVAFEADAQVTQE